MDAQAHFDAAMQSLIDAAIAVGVDPLVAQAIAQQAGADYLAAVALVTQAGVGDSIPQ